MARSLQHGWARVSTGCLTRILVAIHIFFALCLLWVKGYGFGGDGIPTVFTSACFGTSQHAMAAAPPGALVPERHVSFLSSPPPSTSFGPKSSFVKLADEPTVVMMTNKALPKLGHCALVGSSSSLVGQGHGKTIDAFGTVIRVNRMPTPEFHADFGKRADIIFLGPRAEGTDFFGKQGMQYRTFGGEVKGCSYYTHDCPFASVVWKGSDSFEHDGFIWDEVWPKEEPGWKPLNAAIAMGYQSDKINTFAYRLLTSVGHKLRPSNGFNAFVTFLPLCDNLTLYGFSGKAAADNHHIDHFVHNLVNEHEIMRKGLTGKVLPKHWDREMRRFNEKRTHLHIVD